MNIDLYFWLEMNSNRRKKKKLKRKKRKKKANVFKIIFLISNF